MIPAHQQQRVRRVSTGRSSAAFAWSEAQSDARALAGSRDPLILLAGVVGLADGLLIIAFSALAFMLRHGIGPVPLDVFTISVLASLLGANFLSILGAYGAQIRKGFVSQAWTAIQAWTLVFVLLMIFGYFTKTLDEYSRVWATIWYFSVALGLLTIRIAAAAKVNHWKSRGRLASTLAIVDLVGRSADFQRRLAENRTDEVRLLGVFSPENVARPRSGIIDLIALSRLFRIDEIVVLVGDDTNGAAPGELAGILRRLGTIPTNVRICPLLPDLRETAIRGTTLLHNIPVLTVHQRPLGAWSSVAKRIEDVVIASVAAVLLSPLLALIALAIKLDSPGPVIFRQARQGFNNNVITVLKFRSMTHQPAPKGMVVQAVRNDPRVTRLGRILRRTSLDELPQIFNVLNGNMSIVGPRPHALSHNDQYSALIDDYLGRHRVQPGITGWAQVNGFRGETDTLEKMRKRVEFDLAYINNWSIGLDLKIIVLTAFLIFFDREAY